MDIRFLLDLALILFASKFLGVIMKKLGLPEVAGALLAGILLGSMALNVVKGSDMLKIFGEIGVIMIMFTAGLETDLKQLKANGTASLIVTSFGVIIPLAGGFLLSCLFNGGFNVSRAQILTNLFYGVVLTATSVSITVATLRELGKLSKRTGTVIVSAAILDDIIGLCVLTFIVSLKDSSVSFITVLINTLLFFVFAAAFGIAMHYLFKFLLNKYPHNRRMSIFSLVFCFIFAFIAEEYFSIAAITGAFIAGAVLSNIKSIDYVKSRVDVSAYMFFAPMFFAGIGINNAFGAFNTDLLVFGLLFIITGMAAKIIGCGLGAKLCGFSWKESLFVGIGMMPRAEVMLITVTIGIQKGMLDTVFIPYALGLVVISSLLTPILLKITGGREDKLQPLLNQDMQQNQPVLK